MIGCKFFFTDEEIHTKYSRILDKENSMILNASEIAMKNIFSDNQHSEKHLSKINSKSTKDISPKQTEPQKSILVPTPFETKKEEFSLPAHKDITIITTETSQSKSYSNSNNIIDNASINTSNTDENITTQKIAINIPTKTDLTHTTEHNNISILNDDTTYSSQNNINNPSHQNNKTVEHQSNANILLKGNSKTF
ncbi:hypothetical protein [Borrelia turicatae]|uniref:hypothetical protein n=1 Tax=Borrelia turicatae TaxID=142 RepID=UPI001FF17AD7|nr:hypothetical protein [Borrelia turicatae]UPA15664.1 hypothetical protein btBTE5EL_001365 [Borrelia turicatae]